MSFFFNDPAPTAIFTLPLPAPLPISIVGLQNSDAITATYFTAATSASPAGLYAIVPTAVDSTPATLLNYDVTLVSSAQHTSELQSRQSLADHLQLDNQTNPTLTASIV